MADVVLTRAKGTTQGDIDNAVSTALDELNYTQARKIESVVIKPNLCYYWDCSTGETTDPRIVSATIDWVRQRIGKDVTIAVAEADASAMRTGHAFRMLGFEKLGQEKNVKLINLSEGEVVEREVVVEKEKSVLPMNKILLDADLVINVPKLKYHTRIGLTCALKNMFGAIAKPEKHVYHARLASTIVGANKIVKSNIVVVDGVIGLGKTPKRIGAIMASDNALAADYIAAKAMCLNPSRIAYLRLGIKERIGDLSDLNLVENPMRLEDLKRAFPRPSFLSQRLSWTLQLKMVRLYSRISKDVVPPVLDEADL